MSVADIVLSVGPILSKSLLITVFVAVMMILVEYGNVLSLNRLRHLLCGSRFTQYAVASLLGVLPGCLGAFVIVALYVHRSVRLGAAVACMIATSGDEVFVMLTLIPQTAVAMSLGLMLAGIVAGVLTDLFTSNRPSDRGCDEMTVHDDLSSCRCFDSSTILGELRRPSAARGTLVIGTVAFGWAVVAGTVGPPEWGWIRVTLLVTAAITLFVVTTVPQHFIDEHLWRHVVLGHVPRIFAWTLGAMILVSLLDTSLGALETMRENPWLMLVGAALVGIVPESGPHLIVVMLYVDGSVPVSVLVASSIVQDGHGMLPMLAHSRRAFLIIKAINLAAGLIVGGAMMALGW